MSLEIKVRKILDNFEDASSEQIISILNEIKPKLQNQITQEYLNGKIKVISDSTDISKQKILCRSLKPYLDWYLQGI